MLAPAALVHLATGVLYVRAGSALDAVVETQGDDLRHMMAALARLRLAFQVEVVVSVISLLLALCITLLTSSTYNLEIQ